MDFRRLEIILVAVFVALDIFLFVSYRQNQNVFLSTSVTQSGTESIPQDMKDDNISVNKLSDSTQTGYYLASRPNQKLSADLQRLTNQTPVMATSDELTSRFYEPINYKKGKAVSTAESLLKEKNRILFGDAYHYAPELSTDSELVFVQNNNGQPVFDTKARLEFQLDDGAIIGYTQHYVDQFIVLQEKNIVISAKDAVDNLYTDSEIPTNSTVVWYRLAYYGFLDAKGSTIYIPTWYIGIRDNSTKNMTLKLINGFTGILIKNQTTDTTTISST